MRALDALSALKKADPSFILFLSLSFLRLLVLFLLSFLDCDGTVCYLVGERISLLTSTFLISWTCSADFYLPNSLSLSSRDNLIGLSYLRFTIFGGVSSLSKSETIFSLAIFRLLYP